MLEYETLGHMQVADELDKSKPHYYVPHHSVRGKFRVVFDASMKTSNGRSLNDLQLVGPKLQPDLFDLMLQFRAGQVAITADVKKMYRQVRIHPEQWDYQRIFWRADPEEDLKEYQLLVVTYGLASAGYNAVKAMNQCAADHVVEFPLAAQLVRKSFYMDDLLLSTDSVGEAMEVRSQIEGALRKGGFELGLRTPTRWSRTKALRKLWNWNARTCQS